jgi:hypothetical protein
MLFVVYGIIYAISSAGETVAVKSLNYNSVPLTLPTYTAFLSNQMWIFLLPVYYYQWKERNALKNIWGQNIILGILLFSLTLLRNISLTFLPGSVFSLLISTSIFFNIVLSKLFLAKIFTLWHFAAAFFCLGSALSISFVSLLTNQEEMQGANFKIGVSTGFVAAFLLGLTNVVQEYIQPTWDNYDIRIVEMSIISSIVASILIIVYATFTKEITSWPIDIGAATQDRSGLILVACVSTFLPILKIITRNFKYATINHSSAFFFEFMQSTGSLLGSLACILVFNEPWSIGYIVAICLMTISFVLYAQTKKKVEMPPPPSYPKGEIQIINPLDTVKVQKSEEKIVSTVSLWK